MRTECRTLSVKCVNEDMRERMLARAMAGFIFISSLMDKGFL